MNKMIKCCSVDNSVYEIRGNHIYDIVSPVVSIDSIIGLTDKEKRIQLFVQGKKLIDNNVDISLNNIDISQNDLSGNLIIEGSNNKLL